MPHLLQLALLDVHFMNIPWHEGCHIADSANWDWISMIKSSVASHIASQ